MLVHLHRHPPSDKKATRVAAGPWSLSAWWSFRHHLQWWPLALRPRLAYIYPRTALHLAHQSPTYPDFRQQLLHGFYQLHSARQGQPKQILPNHLFWEKIEKPPWFILRSLNGGNNQTDESSAENNRISVKNFRVWAKLELAVLLGVKFRHGVSVVGPLNGIWSNWRRWNEPNGPTWLSANGANWPKPIAPDLLFPQPLPSFVYKHHSICIYDKILHLPSE